MTDKLLESGASRVLLSASSLPDSVPDQKPGKGPLSGIHAAIQMLDNGVNLLVVPVDMPLLPVSVCQRLMEKVEGQPLMVQGFMLPMILPVNEALRSQIELQINSSDHRDYSLRKLHKALKGNSLPLPEHETAFFQNTNTPEDWQNALTFI
jgi:molybdopterin-guanine dinucleotide biosynthesis protein A